MTQIHTSAKRDLSEEFPLKKLVCFFSFLAHFSALKRLRSSSRASLIRSGWAPDGSSCFAIYTGLLIAETACATRRIANEKRMSRKLVFNVIQVNANKESSFKWGSDKMCWQTKSYKIIFSLRKPQEEFYNFVIVRVATFFFNSRNSFCVIKTKALTSAARLVILHFANFLMCV